LCANHDEHVRILLNKLSTSPEEVPGVKVGVVRTLYRLFGGTLTSRLIQGYSRLRLSRIST
jgi:hypothetical protein